MKHKMVALEAHVIILILSVYIFFLWSQCDRSHFCTLSFFFYLCILPEKFHWNWN